MTSLWPYICYSRYRISIGMQCGIYGRSTTREIALSWHRPRIARLEPLGHLLGKLFAGQDEAVDALNTVCILGDAISSPIDHEHIERPQDAVQCVDGHLQVAHVRAFGRWPFSGASMPKSLTSGGAELHRIAVHDLEAQLGSRPRNSASSVWACTGNSTTRIRKTQRHVRTA